MSSCNASTWACVLSLARYYVAPCQTSPGFKQHCHFVSEVFACGNPNVSPVAFFASCCNSHTLVAQLLHCDTDIIFHLPDKSDTSEWLKQLLPNWVPLVDNITQRSIQDLLDRVQSSKLLANCNLRDIACLNKQSKGLHTQAWLQGVPNPNLGLALTSSEFSVALCYWL